MSDPSSADIDPFGSPPTPPLPPQPAVSRRAAVAVAMIRGRANERRLLCAVMEVPIASRSVNAK